MLTRGSVFLLYDVPPVKGADREAVVRLLRTPFLAALMLAACTDVFIQPREKDATNVDNRLAVTGTVCTSAPDPTGFPVKVVFIVDQSGSMCVSDPPGSQQSSGFCEMYAVVPPGITQPARVRALNLLLDQFATAPNVEVALVPFETNVPPSSVWPQATGAGASRFARPDGSLRARVNGLQAELGKGTDYQGALAYTYSLIASDIDQVNRNNPELLPRTRYVVVFLTDGVPFPRCSANDNLQQYADDLNPDLTWADAQGAGDFCNLIDPQDPDAITGFVAGTDRNQNYQLFSYVDQLMELKLQYNIGDIRLHSVLLFNTEAVRACGPICQDLYGRYVRYPGGGAAPVPVADGPTAAHNIARWVLQQLALRGNGVYQEFNDFYGIGQLSLGALDYSSLMSKNVMKTLLVQPMSSEPGEVDRVVDADGDGLPDTEDNDFSWKTNKFFADTDGDGFDDRFEVYRRDDGFRADQKDGRGCDPASPLTSGCVPRDTDGDGLSQYAEDYLDTRTTLVDSDGDGIPDGLEVKYGLDPLKPQAAGLDTDGDTLPDSEEFRLGSNPIARDRPYLDKNAFQYELSSTARQDGSVCYDFRVSNIELVTPEKRAGLRQGFNLFKLWFAEAPESGVGTDYGVWRTACVWAQYDPPSVRIPAGPEAPALQDQNFIAPSSMVDPAQYESSCVGVSPSRGQTGPVP